MNLGLKKDERIIIVKSHSRCKMCRGTCEVIRYGKKELCPHVLVRYRFPEEEKDKL